MHADTWNDLSDLINTLGSPTVLVVGDLILDRYTFGNADRISPEAPVPVLRVNGREDRLGGAASVASMLHTLKANTILAGIVGDDETAIAIRRHLARIGIQHDAVITSPGRLSTLKERIVGLADSRHPQQLIRIDTEDVHALGCELEKELVSRIERCLANADIVLISDYSKGVCTPKLMRSLIDGTARLNRKVLVDPGRMSQVSVYRGCSCLTPNRAELGKLTGFDISTTEQMLTAAEHLRESAEAEAVVVTLDKEGMALVHRDGRRKIIPTRARQVYDVTGAGDMVISVLGLCLAKGHDYNTAIELANLAAGLEVERFGASNITFEDLTKECLGISATMSRKIRNREEIMNEVTKARERGKCVVFTNGCFDLLHAGHVALLNHAKSLGDVLIVGLNGDESVRRLKGEGRPLNSSKSRAGVLTGLASVDLVVIFEEDHPLELIQALRPDILVKGEDYELNRIIGRDFLESYGGRVIRLPLLENHSTTQLVRQAVERFGGDRRNGSHFQRD